MIAPHGPGSGDGGGGELIDQLTQDETDALADHDLAWFLAARRGGAFFAALRQKRSERREREAGSPSLAAELPHPGGRLSLASIGRIVRLRRPQ